MTAPAWVNIAQPLVEQARQRPDVPALIEPRGMASGRPRRERRWSFAELDAETDRLARGLRAAGIGRGTRTVLMVPPSLEFYALTFALFKLGAVIVLVDPGMGVRNLGVCLGEAEPEAFIGVTKAHMARLLLGWARRTLKRNVTVGPRLGWGGPTLADLRRDGAAGAPVLEHTAADEMAAVLFTSGSTGVAKGAVYTHAIFAEQVRLLRTTYDIQPGEVDLPTFPLFGLFGPALGMTAVIPEMDATRPARVDPRVILHSVRHYSVTNLFGSPALLRRVAFAPEAAGARLPTLRRVISAGAPVPATVIRQMVGLLSPGVQVHTPYGATEALPVASIGSKELLAETAELTCQGKGVCVGAVVPGMTVKIIRITDEPIATWTDDLELPPGQIGEIVVSGPVVTRSYFHRPESTRLHKMTDPARGSLWHRMGDVGYRDERGRVWFCGRKAHRVILADTTLFTIPVEGVFNAHSLVQRTALVGVRRGGVMVPVLCIELDRDHPQARRLHGDRQARQRFFDELRQLGSQYDHTRAIDTFLLHRGFPVDIRHNAKIFREKLAVWAARQLRAEGG